MLFNSIEFVLFLPIVVLTYFLIPHRFRWLLLLTTSYYFYLSWKLEYLLLIVASTLIDYFAGIAMEKQVSKRRRWPFLLLSLCSNIGLLLFFKYANFALENANDLLALLGSERQLPLLRFLLPVGISFYTFQTLSYAIDVFRGLQKAERHLGHFALYVSFFPQLVAGPIERFSRLSPQLKARHAFSYDNLVHGLRLILYGLFIKMVVADNLASIVDPVFAAPTAFSSSDILTGMCCYSVQIYSDFYGYSIIAIGSARLMGIHLMDNFKTPYLSKSIAEFWQRWHISLSNWFRDYVYYPLGGNKVKTARWVLNIILVFVVSGVWHGANWTFVVWGAVFGSFYLLEKGTNKLLNIHRTVPDFSIPHLLLALKTLGIVTLAWVFFRSDSVADALTLLNRLFSARAGTSALPVLPTTIWCWLLLFIVSDIGLYNRRFDRWVGTLPILSRWLIYGALIFGIIVYAGVEHLPFIYFQF